MVIPNGTEGMPSLRRVLRNEGGKGVAELIKRHENYRRELGAKKSKIQTRQPDKTLDYDSTNLERPKTLIQDILKDCSPEFKEEMSNILKGEDFFNEQADSAEDLLDPDQDTKKAITNRNKAAAVGELQQAAGLHKYFETIISEINRLIAELQIEEARLREELREISSPANRKNEQQKQWDIANKNGEIRENAKNQRAANEMLNLANLKLKPLENKYSELSDIVRDIIREEESHGGEIAA